MAGIPRMDLIKIDDRSDLSQSVSVILDGGVVIEFFGEFYYRVKLVVASTFLSGSLDLSVSKYEILEWKKFLDGLERDPDLLDSMNPDDPLVVWPSRGKTPYFRIYPQDPILVEVVDSPVSQVRAFVPLDVDVDDFIRSGQEMISRALCDLGYD